MVNLFLTSLFALLTVVCLVGTGAFAVFAYMLLVDGEGEKKQMLLGALCAVAAGISGVLALSFAGLVR